MALPSWPSELPERPSQQGYSYGFGDGRLSTDMDSGPPKMRRRSSSAVRPVTASFMGDADAMARLERFWDEDTRGGTLPFTIVNPRTHGLPAAAGSGETLLTDSGDQLLVSAYDVAMMGKTAPQITPIGGLEYRASYSLTILPI